MKYLSILALSVILLMPVTSSAAPVSPAIVPHAPAEWEFVRDASGRHFGKQIIKQASYDEDDMETLYRMRKGELTDHFRTRDRIFPSDQAIWDMFVGIAGRETIQKRMLAFGTYEDPMSLSLASVQKLDRKKEQSWMLAVNANAARPESTPWRREMSIVLLHEYAHILTLKKDQLDAKKTAAALCKKLDTYHVAGYGCTTPKSYLNAFTKRFWSSRDMHDSAKAVERDVVMDLYRGRKSEFVTWYAASGPEEDIAESFTDFVLRKKPAGITENEQKILFFYEYPELVKMRTDIRTNIRPNFR